MMRLNYDFDIYSEVPRGIFSENHSSRQNVDVKEHPFWNRHNVALFRDPKTVSAFNTAPKKIRKIFLDSCFATSQSYSKVPKGYYLQEDEDFRMHVFAELEKNLNTQLSKSELNALLTVPKNDPQTRRYAFHNRLNKIKKRKHKDTYLAQAVFHIGEFINASYDAKGVSVPKAISDGLAPVVNKDTKEINAKTFWTALMPRMFFLGFMYVFGTTQISILS
jgi:hypothetical protein